MTELPAQFDVGDLRVDLGQQRVQRGGSDIPLPKLSFEVLVALAHAAPNIVSIDDLMSTVWAGLVVSPETVSQRIKLLRDALGDDARQPRYITGLRGRGYRLLPDITRIPQPAPASLKSEAANDPLPTGSESPPGARRRGPPTRRVVWALVTAAVLLTIVGVAWRVGIATKKPASSSPPAKEVTVTALPPRAVAVLPFEDLSLSRDNGQLALGLAEMVLQRLGSVKELLVIARSSSFTFAGKQIDAREIGRRLSARYLVEGAVQRIDDRLRVTAQLIDAESGHELRALSFDRRMSDIFELQDEIAQQVAAALEVQLTGSDLKRVDRSRSTSLPVYLSYLRAQALLNNWKVADTEQAVTVLAQALVTDPSFALGYAELARARYFARFLRTSRTDGMGPELLPLVEKALALDPRLGEAYSMRGQLQTDPKAAESDFLRGLELAPNYGPGYEMYAEVLHDNLGRPKEAAAMIDRAILIDPIAPRNIYIKGLFAWIDRGAEEEAERLMLHSLQISPGFAPALSRLGQFRWENGRIAEGAGFLERALQADPQAAWMRENACALYLEVGDFHAAADVAAGMHPPVCKILLALYNRDFREPAPEFDMTLVTTDAAYYGYWTYVNVRGLQAGKLPQSISALRAAASIAEGQEGAEIPQDAELGARFTLAGWLAADGQSAAAARLAAALRQWADRYAPDRGFIRASTQVLAGQHEEAMISLLSDMHGRHVPLWWLFDRDPIFASLRTDRRYAGALAELKVYAAQQRRLIEQMRERGEIPRR